MGKRFPAASLEMLTLVLLAVFALLTNDKALAQMACIAVVLLSAVSSLLVRGLALATAMIIEEIRRG